VSGRAHCLDDLIEADPVNTVAAPTKVRGNQRVASPTPEGAYVALKKYGRDLFADAGSGLLIVPGDSPAILRDNTIDSGRSNGRSPRARPREGRCDVPYLGSRRQGRPPALCPDVSRGIEMNCTAAETPGCSKQATSETAAAPALGRWSAVVAHLHGERHRAANRRSPFSISPLTACRPSPRSHAPNQPRDGS
jgi:hypothetical protein